MIRRFRAVVPSEGTRGPQPVWRVGTVLKAVIGLSRPERARAWRDGGVTVNGDPVAAQHLHCFPGDVVEAWYPEPSSTVAQERQLPLRVLYEDAWLLAVDKPAGQLSHPARSEQSGTTANAVAAYLARHPHVHVPSSKNVDKEHTHNGGFPTHPPPSLGEGPGARGDQAEEPVRLVHRLDRNTSGVLVFARDAATARVLARQRAAGRLERTYLALVAGHPPSRGDITLALGPDPGHRTRQRAYAPDVGATVPTRPARTTYRVVQYGTDAALIALWLHTGRTHQVRAHCAAIGHPLLGDDLYGGPLDRGITRQALHAWRTRLRHPHTGAMLTIHAPLPQDFRAAARLALSGCSPSGALTTQSG